ncbi:uncharacterized protein [Antedon mediterranea]|uniref:uncharacterized protein n=1 Tax=Antedon mediterranea TaxID=105859 RepID=UPI003AF600FF
MESNSDMYDISGIISEPASVVEQATTMLTCAPSSTPGLRRGGRVRKQRAVSPDIQQEIVKAKKRGPKSSGAEKSAKPFCCDNCKSPYIVNPKRSISKKDPKRAPAPRYKVDPETGKKLILCNACGLLFNRQQKSVRIKPPVATEADRKKFAEDCEKFAQSMATRLNDPEAARFTCNIFKSRPCGCLQKYIYGDDGTEGWEARANTLLDLFKKAKVLRLKKCYDEESVDCKGRKKIGLGNGHKKSKEYEEFVLKKRQYLRELKICEVAVKKVLLYSNNFLHRGLKTEARPWRVQRVRGKSARGLLKTIEELQNEKCCDDQCILLAKTYGVLVKNWRERATSSQTEARKVLAEMLIPSGGRTNCFNFIAMVTGSSARTIGRVKQQMQVTGGNREPPPHGLKKYWEKNPYHKQPKLSTRTSSEPSTTAVTSSNNTGGSSSKATPTDGGLNTTETLPNTKEMSPEELKQHQSNLEKMQSHLEEKRQRIEQQQRLVEEQLKKHKLAEQQRKKQQEQLIEQQLQQQKLAEQRQKEQQRLAQLAQANHTDSQTFECSKIAQLFSEMQGQFFGQQLQQQLLTNQATGQAAAQAIQNAAVLNATHPPPSYNVAVALNSTNAAAQQSSSTSSNQSQPALVFQASHVSVLQNLLLGNTPVHSQQLLGMHNQQPQLQHTTLSPANQQILVSLAQNFSSLNSELNADSSLSDQSSSDTSQDQLNLSDVMTQEGNVEHLSRLPVNQSKGHRVHQLVGESSNHEIAILVPNTNNNGSHSSTDHSGTVESLLSSDALQIFSENSENIILQSIPVSITMPTIPSSS